MKKLINSQQKLGAEYSCQECRKNEAVLQIKGSGWLHHLKGGFCEDCAIQKIRFWHCPNMPKFNLICADCGRYKDRQGENNFIEIARRMRKT